jgi:YaiO family outer membrane protein
VLKKDIMDNHRFKDYVFMEDYFESFREPFLSRKLIASTGISKWTKYGTYIGKINMGEEFAEAVNQGDPLPSYPLPAFQWELEAYQQLFPVNYLWLNYAGSQNDFFPIQRGGIEFFQRLPEGFEVSLGTRFMHWTDLDVMWIYTGSISWLHNRNYLAFRPFFSNTGGRWVDTYILIFRHYFSDSPNDYAFALAGYGNYSDEFMQLNPNPGSSYLTQIGLLKYLTIRWTLSASVGYARESGYRNRFQALAGVRYYFNMSQ